jgi:hypothetical protein
MAGFPHPVTITNEAERRRIDLLHQVDRDRQRLLAELDIEERQQWVALSAVVLLLMSLAFVLALHGAVS